MFLALVAVVSFGWLVVNRCGMCVITLDLGLALIGSLAGGLGAAALSLAVVCRALFRCWDERRSRRFRLTP